MAPLVADDVVERVKAVVFPASAFLLCVVYPIFILVWLAMENRAAREADKESAPEAGVSFCKEPSDPLKDATPAAMKPLLRPAARAATFRQTPAVPLVGRIKGAALTYRRAGAATLVCAVISAVFSDRVAAGLGFAAFGVNGPPADRASPAGCAVEAQSAPHAACDGVAIVEPVRGGWAPESLVLGSFVAAGALVGLGAAWLRSKRPLPVEGMLKRRGQGGARRIVRQALNGLCGHGDSHSGGISSWHHVDLHAKTWLDENTGHYHVVNEIARGTLKKYEVQTKLPGNIITEDEKGSRKLKAFGQDVPFNYGCFPQTWRDPEVIDDIYGAGGDNDPLDVINLTPETLEVGQVTRCRPLGAVCLIDEGAADWKVFVVSVDSSSPLASCESLDEVQRVAPGRVEEAMGWMDRYKKFSAGEETQLHYTLHGPEQAYRLIEQDYASYCELVSKAGPSGVACGHWIHPPLEAHGPAHHQANAAPLHTWPGPDAQVCTVSAGAPSMGHGSAVVAARALHLCGPSSSSDSEGKFEDSSVSSEDDRRI